MKKLLISTVLIILLSACGGGDNSQSNLSTESVIATRTSKLAQFMDKPSICDIIEEKTIQQLFGTSQKVNTFDSGPCYYSWRRADAKQREEKATDYMMQSLSGKAVKVSMRQRAIEHKFSIEIKPYNSKPEYFMPRKLSQQELDKQIAEAKKRTLARLSKEQIELAGKAAVSMIVNQLRKNNENIEVKGVGDIAYWSEVGLGGLHILDGGTKIFISVMIGDTIETDIENAKKIFATINQ